MSAPDAGSAAAVTKSGNCDRIVFRGKDKHASNTAGDSTLCLAKCGVGNEAYR